MADKNKTRKPMTSKGKALIAMCVMLVLTLCVSWLSIAGTKLDPEGVKILLPWVPLTAGQVPASLTLGLDVGDGNAADITVDYLTTPATETAETDETAGTDETAQEQEKAETVVEYTAEFKADVEKAKAVFEKRLSAMDRMGTVTVTGDNTLQVAYPKYVNVNGDDVSTAIMTAMSSAGEAVLTAGEQSLTSQEAFKGFRVQYYSSTSGAGYALFLNLTGEANTLVSGALDEVSFTLDGEEIVAAGNMSNYYNASDNSIVLSLSTNAAAQAYGALITCGTLPVKVSSIAANAEGVSGNKGLLNTILIVMWVIFLVCCVYMIIRNRFVGLAATWSMWLYMVFFFFLIATVVLPVLTVLNWFAVILAELFALYLLLVILKEMDDGIVSGKDARAAVRGGFQASVKQTWLIVGVELALGLLLMILSVTRQFGAILVAGAIVNAVCGIGLFRWFAPCLTIVGNSTRQSVSAKAAH